METGEMAQEMSETFCKSFNGKWKKVCAKIWRIRQKYNNIILSSIQRCDIQHNDIRHDSIQHNNIKYNSIQHK